VKRTALLALALGAPSAGAVARAQSGSAASTMGVMLQIRPHVGDTLRMRLDQETEMVAIKRNGAVESKASVVNTMRMFSRAIVEESSVRGTTVLAVTDSVVLFSTDDPTRKLTGAMQRQLRGQRVRFRVEADGSMRMSTADDPPPREVAEVVSLMPAPFPKAGVMVGESWNREMPLPAGTQLDAPLSGTLRVTFRFDSLGRGGDLAYLSMRGEMVPAPGPGSSSATMVESGAVTGTMLVDRRRGWLTDSRFTIVVVSTIAPSPSTGPSPMRMHLRITQHMATQERR